MYQSIAVEIDGAIGILTLNRPGQHNALNGRVVSELTHALLALDSNSEVRVIILSATGKTFCAGADREWIKRSLKMPHKELEAELNNLARLLNTLNRLSKPTIARVQGSAFGRGVGLLATCDIVVAMHDAYFAFAETRLGLAPALSAPYVLAAIGERHARRYLLTAERFSAAEAFRMGLIHQVVQTEEALDEMVWRYVDEMLKNSPFAIAESKGLIHELSGKPISETMIKETVRCAVDIHRSAEAKNGLKSFLEKRDPVWKIN